MSDAAASRRQPVPAEGMGGGDVLSSIRRMIAHEDERPSPGKGVLRLEASAAVQPSAGMPDAEARAAALRWAMAAAGAAGVDRLIGPMPVPASTEARAAVTAEPSVAGPADEPAAMPSPVEQVRAAVPLPTAALPEAASRRADGEDAAPSATSPTTVPTLTPTLASPSAVAESPRGTSDQPTTPSLASENPMSLYSLSATAPVAAQAPAAEPEASLLATIIRDVLRQQLEDDADGRVAAELRAMILQEVARVISGKPVPPRG